MRSRNIALVLFSLAYGFLAQIRAEDDKKVPPLNAKVLAYCAAQQGKQVGNGECWTLADEALGAAGARRPNQDGYATYVFGRALKADEPILPGDIVQFNDAMFVTTTSTKEFTLIMKLHTGIVSKVDGTRFQMLNQNLGRDRTVMLTSLDRADLKEGKMQFFRPQPVK